MRSETIKWVGGEHDFALPITLLEALQDRCGGDGVGLIYHRMSAGISSVQDIVATVALGLEGGGMKKQDSVKMVRTIAEDHGLNKLSITAQAILGGALNGWPDEGDDQGEAGVETPKTSKSTGAK